MKQNIFDYIYYKTYTIISKTNYLSPIHSSAYLLSISAFINVMSIFLLFKNNFSIYGFYVFCGIGIFILFYILNRFNERNAKRIIKTYGLKKVNKIWDYLIDYYPDLSIFLLVVFTIKDFYVSVFWFAFLVLIRIILYIIKEI